VQYKPSLTASAIVGFIGSLTASGSTFQNLRQYGGKFDHRTRRPKVLLRHWLNIRPSFRVAVGLKAKELGKILAV